MSDALDAAVEKARRQLANYLYEDGATSNAPLWSAFESAIAARACRPLVEALEEAERLIHAELPTHPRNRAIRLSQHLRAVLAAHREKQP